MQLYQCLSSCFHPSTSLTILNKEKRNSLELNDLPPLKILIAEDVIFFGEILVNILQNNFNQKVLQMSLTSLGYSPDIASNGKEVLEMLGNNYDLILMDLQVK